MLPPRHIPGSRHPRAGLFLALISLWLGLLWVAASRPLNAPDEPAYLQTVMQVRNEQILPEIHFDFTSNPAGTVLDSPGDPAARAYAVALGYGDPIRSLAYQTVQPPLYFLITALVAQLVPPSPPVVMYLSRLVSAIFGAAAVYFCWAATRELAPRAPQWAVGVAGVIALMPEWCFNNARVANDSLVNCLGTAAFYLWFRSLRQPEYDPRMLRAGAVVGLALLAKLTALVLVPGLALVVVFRAFQARTVRERLPRGMRMGAGAGASLLLVCGWWFVRNLIAYGEPSGTAAANLFWRLNLPGLNWADPASRLDFLASTWYSFWGYFGWQDIALPSWFYDQVLPLSLALLGLSSVAALVLIARRVWRRVAPPAHAWQAALLMVLVAGLLIFGFVQFSLTVAMQAQGRYLFLALLPAALAFTGGLYVCVPDRRLRTLAFSGLFLWLALVNATGILAVG